MTFIVEDRVYIPEEDNKTIYIIKKIIANEAHLKNPSNGEMIQVPLDSIKYYDEYSKKTLKHELKPFDRVLVRKPDLIDPHDIYEPDEWVPTLFQGVSNDGCYFIAEHKEWNECIPYEGNEDLVGTTINLK